MFPRVDGKLVVACDVGGTYRAEVQGGHVERECFFSAHEMLALNAVEH